MKKTSADILDYYNIEVVKLICQKYGFDAKDAFFSFAKSETHRMLSDSKFEMWEFGAPAIFDMWECEKISGSPRNSLYIRGEM